MWQCLEKVAAIAGGCVVAAAGSSLTTAGIDPGTAVGAVIGGVGIIGFFGERAETHGPESARYLSRIRAAVIEELGEPPEWHGAGSEEIAGWDWSLAHALPECMLDRRALAQSFFTEAGFPDAAAGIVVAALAASDDVFAVEPASGFARHVVRTALARAYRERTYFESLAPDLWDSLARKLNQIQSAADLAASRAGTAAEHAREAAETASRIERKADLRHGLVPLRYAPLTRGQLELLPTRLLVADHGAVPYIPLSGIDDELVDWATTGDGVRGRLIVGPGGFGKTRLALEVAERLAALGWRHSGRLSAAELDLPHAQRELQVMAIDSASCGLFLILDYADTRVDQVRKLVRAALTAQALEGRRPVRLLLIARSAGSSEGGSWREVKGDWWSNLLDASAPDTAPERQCLDPIPTAIRATHRVGAAEAASFIAAAQRAFADRLADAGLGDRVKPESARGGIAPAWLARDDATSPLLLSIAAYLSLLGSDVADPLAEIVHDEASHWRRAMGTAATDTQLTRAMRQAAGEVTLCQGLPLREAEAVARRACASSLAGTLPAIEIARAELRIAAALRTLYADTYLRPVLPDLVGECIAGQALADQPQLVTALLDQRPEASKSLLHVINRIGLEPPEGATDLRARLAPVAVDALAAALGEPVRYLQVVGDLLRVATREQGGLPHAAAKALEGLPRPKCGTTAAMTLATWFELYPNGLIPLHLRALFATVALLASEFSYAEGDYGPVEVDAEEVAAADAHLVSMVVIALTEVGKDVDALRAAERAVDAEAAGGGERIGRLGSTLVNLAGRLVHLGKEAEALAASERAITLLRQAEQEGDKVAAQSLVLALMNQAALLSRANRVDEAVRHAREGVALIESRPDVRAAMRQNDVAGLYLNLASSELESGNLEAATEAIETVLEIRARLLEKNRSMFAPAFANGLLVQAGILEAKGDVAKAQTVLLEAARLLSEHTALLTPREGAAFSDACRRYLGLAEQLDQSQAQAKEAIHAVTGMTIETMDDSQSLESRIARLREMVAFFHKTTVDNPYMLSKQVGSATSTLAFMLMQAGDMAAAFESATQADHHLSLLIETHGEPLHTELMSVLAVQEDCARALGHPIVELQRIRAREILLAAATPPEAWAKIAMMHFGAFETYSRAAFDAGAADYLAVLASIGSKEPIEHPLFLAENRWVDAHNLGDISTARMFYEALREMIATEPEHPFGMRIAASIEQARAGAGAGWDYD